MKVRMIDMVRENNNVFWESVRIQHLDALLNLSYSNPLRCWLVKRWLSGAAKRRLVLRQMDFYSDPLVIEFMPDGYNIWVSEDAPDPEGEVVVDATHMAIISSSTNLFSFATAWLLGEIKVWNVFSRVRDIFYAALIFLT